MTTFKKLLRPISALSVLEGNLRTYRDETYDACCRGMEKIGAQIERETGCTVEVKLGISYPAVWNHEGLLESVRRQLGSEAPAVLETPAMAAEEQTRLLTRWHRAVERSRDWLQAEAE